MRCVFSLALAAEPIAAAHAAAPASIDLPADSLARSIERLAAQTGVSIGAPGPLPPLTVPAIHRARSVGAALDRLLRGTGYHAVQVSPRAYRIEALPVAQPARPSRPAPVDLGRLEPEIIITARKRVEALSQAPATVRVVDARHLQSAMGVPGTADAADQDAALTVAQLGSGASRLFLRGIGDAPLNGFNQASVAVLFDDARLTYDAPDPDFALVDVDRIEILEGPQGPLYGTGALGGIVKIEPNKPDLSHTSGLVRAGGAALDDSGLSNFQSGFVNLPLATDRLGLRMVAYRALDAGWIDNAGSRHNANSELLVGGRVAVRWRPAVDWTVDLASAIQSRETRDSQYVDGDLGPLNRPARLREPRDSDIKLASLSIEGPLGALRLTSQTAISHQELVTSFDATPLAPVLGTVGATRVRDDRRYSVFDQEIRLSNDSDGPIAWLGGLSVLKASSNGRITASDALTSVPMLRLDRSILETAAFGEITARLTRALSASAGARLFYNDVEEEGATNSGSGMKARGVVRPSASADLNWTPRPGRQFYLRVATAYRPGGLNVVPEAVPRTYAADHLVTAEAGTRLLVAGGVALDVTAFASRWRHVQADELLSNGLVATQNVGNGENLGVDGELRWAIQPGSSIDVSFLAQTARLDSTADSPIEVDDRRLPVVPHLAIRAHYSRKFQIGAVSGEVRAGAHYTGATHLSFDPLLDRRTGGFLTFDAGLDLATGPWSLAITGENLGNSTEDSFAFGNPYRILFAPQRTPLRPRAIGFQITRKF